jgi:hypothetical protein
LAILARACGAFFLVSPTQLSRLVAPPVSLSSKFILHYLPPEFGVGGDISSLRDMRNILKPTAHARDPSGPELQMLSTAAQLTEPAGGCGGGPVILHAPRCLRHLCKQLRVHHFETVCEHARFAGSWPFAIAAVSAECLCANHHAVQAMMGCPRPCCMCHNYAQG